MRWLPNRTAVDVNDVASLVRLGVLKRKALGRALAIAGLEPSAGGWRVALQRLLIGVGIGLMLAGIICIVAYHWMTVDRAGRFAIGQGALLLVVLLTMWVGIERLSGQRLLTVAIVLIGPLLALFGQIYQTGADTWELFRAWALLAVPWVLASRYAPAWMVWLAVLEVGLWLYWYSLNLLTWRWGGFLPTWAVAALINAAVLVAWEVAGHYFEWLSGRFAPRVIAALLLVTLTLMTAMAVVGASMPNGGLALAPLLWALTLAGGYIAYRVKAIDIGMLAMGWLSLTVVLLCWLIRLTIELRAPSLILLLGAGLLLGASALGRQWLTKAAAEARS